MPGKLNLEIQDFYSHAYIKAEGEYCLDSFLEMILSINKLGMSSESKKVICDIRQIENFTPSDTDRFRMGTALAESVSNQVFVAGLASPESINHFVELVANNRGAHFKVFSCQDAARQWLLEEEVLPKSRFA